MGILEIADSSSYLFTEKSNSNSYEEVFNSALKAETSSNPKDGGIGLKNITDMACAGCTSCGTEAKGVSGCKSNGCSTGGCNRLNTYDWLSANDIQDSNKFEFVEVSFKNGSRKEFFHNPPYTHAITGDHVVVDTGNGNGFDIGRITLSGELVRLQMKKKRSNPDRIKNKVMRVANERDLERLEEARQKEKDTMIRARVLTRTLELNMKVGDVEYQADGKKATFFYTADGRVDFRELIRHYAKEFRVKIEMRQIGIRQESARIGGLGSCGRELCCSTWLTNFKSVNTTAARYQNLAINQAKLSGQCGRLKCCLNFELDAYMDAFAKFPKRAEKLRAQSGTANLFKTDIFKQIMFYSMTVENGRRLTFALDIPSVNKILEMNKKGDAPVDFTSLQFVAETPADEEDFDFDASDLTGVIELPAEKRRKKKRPNRNRNNRNRNSKPQNRGGKPGDNRKPADKNKPKGNNQKSGGQNKSGGQQKSGPKSPQAKGKQGGNNPRNEKGGNKPINKNRNRNRNNKNRNNRNKK